MFGAVFAVGRKSHERRDGTWNFRDYQSPDQEMKVDAIGVAIPLLRIYDRVSILPATN